MTSWGRVTPSRSRESVVEKVDREHIHAGVSTKGRCGASIERGGLSSLLGLQVSGCWKSVHTVCPTQWGRLVRSEMAGNETGRTGSLRGLVRRGDNVT